MVIINLIGGLGNQMFQYAAGRAVALAHDTLLKFDITDFTSHRLHQGFELERIFTCSVEIAKETDMRCILGLQSSSSIRKLISRPNMSIFRGRGFVIEPHFQYWQGIKNVPIDCYLTGYWQSEKYFLDVAGQIRKDFTCKLPMTNQNIELVKKIKQVSAVSLHVRRGDYANNLKTMATHGLCSLDYYRTAIQHVSDRVKQPYFFIFSDDIPWVKENLKNDFPHQYVNHNNGTESYNDMRLMSLCQHHIIANSSFSWWGAWLNPSVSKIVVAPKLWFANQTDVQDLLPQSWVRL
jgi:hypothetical protein